MKKTIATAIIAAFASASAFGADGVEMAVSMLKGFEGFRSTVYKCQAGRDTIGYGFTDNSWTSRKRVTEKEAAEELKRIAKGISAKLRDELGQANTLKPCEEAAVISFVFNVGWGNFKSSTLCRLLKEGKRGAVVAVQFHRWVYVTTGGEKVVSRGLTTRRYKEAATFLKGRIVPKA